MVEVLKNLGAQAQCKRLTDLFIIKKNSDFQNVTRIDTIGSKLAQKFLHLQRDYITQAISYLDPNISSLKLREGDIIPATSDANTKTALRILGVPNKEPRFQNTIIKYLVSALTNPAERAQLQVSFPNDPKTIDRLRTYLLVHATIEFGDSVYKFAEDQLKEIN
jgi:hypothetical protein